MRTLSTRINVITLDADNIELAKEECQAIDQRAELGIGDQIWGILYQPGCQRGQMSRYSTGRGAVSFGGDSEWEYWDGNTLITDDGRSYNELGEQV